LSKTSIKTIEEQVAKLSLQDHIKLMEALSRQLREKSNLTQEPIDWSALYGLGKGLWDNLDAQDYVSGLREDRE
jgi:hypothetical protein